METLYTNPNCPHSRKVSAMLAQNPRKGLRKVEIDFQNKPASVTHVPTLITQSGKTLIGKQVFDYLKRKRQDPTFPETDADGESFTGFMSKKNMMILAAVLILCGICCYMYQKRSI